MKKLIILSALALGMFSCSDEDRLPNDTLTSGNKIVGFQESLLNATYFEDEGPVTIDVPVYIVGLGNGQLSNQDLTVSYTVDTVNSTATQGTEFDFGNASGTVTIPAGSDFAMIPLVVNTGSLNATSATKLILNLVSNDESIIVGQQYSTLTVNFVGCVSQIIEGGYTVARGTGSTIGAGTTYQDVVTLIGTNKFLTAHTPPYLGSNESGSSVGYGFVFEDVCGELTVSRQGLFNGTYGGNPVMGSGMVVDANTFKIDMSVGTATTTYFTYLTFTKN